MSDPEDLLTASAEELEKAERVLKRAERRIQERRHENPKVACPACGCRHSRVDDSRKWNVRESRDYTRIRICLNPKCRAIYKAKEIPGEVIGYQRSA